MSSLAPIVLITDFGIQDPFVGIMKGVIAEISPKVPMIDLTHSIPPGDIKRAAITIWQSISFFPNESIFLGVVDPGVGTSRRGIVIVSDQQKYVGPDNGLFTFILDESAQVWELSDPQYQLPNPGYTFHGRDIFAPAAAYLAQGVQASQFGARVSDILHIPDPVMNYEEDKISGEILFADRFGNLLTSLGRFVPIVNSEYKLEPWLRSASDSFHEMRVSMSQVRLKLADGRSFPWVRTFADIPPGKCRVLVGSSGLLEIAANRGNAAEALGLSDGDPVNLII